MTPADFLTELKSRFPRAKLTTEQSAAFCEGVSKYKLTPDLVETLWETCEKVFPSGADIARLASRDAEKDKPWLAPHRWTQTDCPHCEGEGRVALFGTMLYADDGGRDQFEVQTVAPYSSQDGVDHRREDTGRSTEMFARCVCVAGEAVTLGKGITKWSGDYRVYRRAII